MNKNTKYYLLGVAYGFMGIILYCCMLDGFEHIRLYDVLDYIGQGIIPFIFTEILTAITVEGISSIKNRFINWKEKLNKKETKEAEA